MLLNRINAFLCFFFIASRIIWAQPQFKTILNDGALYYVFNDGYTISQTNFNESEKLYEIATEKWENDLNEEALLTINKSIALNNKNFKSWSRRGTIRLNINDIDGAISDYEQSIQLNPNYEVSWSNRGDAKHRKKNYSEAILDYSEAIRLNPDFYSPWFGRCQAKMEVKDFKGALLDYRKAIRLNPYEARFEDLPECLKCTTSNGELKNLDCLRIQESIIELPFSGEYPSDKFIQGISNFSECIKTDSTNSDYWVFRGRLQSNYAHAIQFYVPNRAIDTTSANENPYEILDNRAREFYNNAIEDFKKAIKLIDKKNKNKFYKQNEIKYFIALTECKMAHYKESIRITTMLINSGVTENRVYLVRGVAKSRSKDYLGAVRDLSKGIELSKRGDWNLFLLLSNRAITKCRKNDKNGEFKDLNELKRLFRVTFLPDGSRVEMHYSHFIPYEEISSKEAQDYLIRYCEYPDKLPYAY